MNITVTQLRMARAALDVSQGVVAESVGVKPMAISDIESGKTKNPKASTLSAMQGFYEGAGLEFTETGGVRPNNAENKTYKGDIGFQMFYNDIYETVKAGGDICIQNGMPSALIQHLGQEFYDMHSSRMVKLSPSVRVLVRQMDDNFIGSAFAEYRTVTNDLFNDQTIYIYGDKTAFITFGDKVEAIVLDKRAITNSLKISFDLIWSGAKSV